MTKPEFNAGDRVSWKYGTGKGTGQIVEKLTKATKLYGKNFKATSEEPKYKIKSDKGKPPPHILWPHFVFVGLACFLYVSLLRFRIIMRTYACGPDKNWRTAMERYACSMVTLGTYIDHVFCCNWHTCNDITTIATGIRRGFSDEHLWVIVANAFLFSWFYSQYWGIFLVFISAPLFTLEVHLEDG